MKVQIFKETSEYKLEKVVNRFLSLHKNATIVGYSSYYKDFDTYYTCMVKFSYF